MLLAVQNMYPYVIKNTIFNLLLLIYILVNSIRISLLFAVKLERCVGSCNTLNDLSNKVCVPNNTEDLNMHVFGMITGKN